MPVVAVAEAARSLRRGIGQRLARAPITAVVRSRDPREAERQARWFVAADLELIEITFTVPNATDLVGRLLAERPAGAQYAVGMGTVTTPERAHAAVAAGAEFIVTPNVSPEVAAITRERDLYLVMGALTPSELVQAHRLGADLLKVYPLPPVGGPAYLAIVRQPLSDLGPMLAGGGFGIEEIPAYRAAGAVAFGIGAPLVGSDLEETRRRVARALALARGENPERG